jgi:hypothetical protein
MIFSTKILQKQIVSLRYFDSLLDVLCYKSNFKLFEHLVIKETVVNRNNTNPDEPESVPYRQLLAPSPPGQYLGPTKINKN